jgi:hypothetical protein
MGEITTDKLDEIIDFIGRERSILMSRINCSSQDELIVLIPEWLLNILSHYISSIVSQPLDSNTLYIYGCRVQYNYRDEIIVFYKSYHVNREVFQPRFYTINQ